MIFHRIGHILKRSMGGIKRRPWLHGLSIITLAAAFLSFTATLTAAYNLDGLLNKWLDTAEITAYVHQSTTEPELQKLTQAIQKLDGVAKATSVNQEQARDIFAKSLGTHQELAVSLPHTAFPASVDIELSHALSNEPAARADLAKRLGKVNMVQKVEIYDDWFNRFIAINTLSRSVTLGLGILAFVVAILVIAATIRTGVTARRQEIEVLRFIGATDTYVRLPFLIEGAIESMGAMGIALLLLNLLMDKTDSAIGEILPLIGGGNLLRLDWTTMFCLIGGGLIAGIIGAGISLKKLEEI